MPFTENTSGTTIGQGGSSKVDPTIFGQYPAASITLGGQAIAFPVLKIEETGGNRLIPRERAYRNGAKIDDTGSKAVGWAIECLFENSIQEPGLSEINKGMPLYPDVLRVIIGLFDIHETADVVIPTVGKRRCRLDSYTRIESFDARDAAALKLTILEDNEDSVRAIEPPSASANARQLAQTTTFTVQQAGAWHTSLADLDQFTADLEALVNAPGNAVQSIRQQSKRIQGNADRAKQAFKNAARTGRDLFLDPTNSRAERKLVQHTEIAARASNEARKGRPKLVQIVFQNVTSLFRVSAITGQSFDDLADVNPLIDPFNIPAQTPVNVFASEELLNGKRTTT